MLRLRLTKRCSRRGPAARAGERLVVRPTKAGHIVGSLFGRDGGMRGTFLVLALFMLGLTGPATAQDRPGPATLGGLKGVFLEVYADRELDSSMAALAAGRLKAAGITLASGKDWQSTQDIGLLHLDVIIRCERDEVSCGYSVVLKLGQHVQLTRGQRTIIRATTWQGSYTASISKRDLARLPDLLAVDASTLVLNFIGDYRTANPR